MDSLQETLKSNTYKPTILTYGDLGKGKTAFLGTAGVNISILDFDAGLKTCASMNDKWKADRNAIKCKSFYEGNPTRPTTFRKARKWLETQVLQMTKEPDKFPGIWAIDSFTGLVKAATYDILYTNGKGHTKPTLQEYGLIFGEIEDFMTVFRALPAIKILTAHDMIQDMEDGSTAVRFLCPGKKLPTTVAGFFDDVLYCKVVRGIGKDNYNYVLTSSATNTVSCRTRSSFREDYNMSDGLIGLIEKLGYDVSQMKGKLNG